MTIAAIETRYAGCRFRSRLEARWAVFFDHLGIRWEYEPKGFVTDAGPYLPDFRLPDLKLIVEIKGPEPTQRDLDRCRDVAMACRKHGGDLIILVGGVPDAHSLKCLRLDRPWSARVDGDHTADLVWDRQSAREINKHRVLSGLIESALHAARSARFEHGEAPARPRRCGGRDRYATERKARESDDLNPFGDKVIHCRECGAWHIIPDD